MHQLRQVEFFHLTQPKETLNNKLRRLRREYKASQRQAIELNQQAIQGIKIQVTQDDPVQRRIRELELSNKALREALTPEVSELVTPKLPKLPLKHDDSAKIAAGRYLTKYAIQLHLANKRLDKIDRPFWRIED